MIDDYQLGQTLAVQWNPELADLFPDADHTGCRQLHTVSDDGRWVATVPARCLDWHCPLCGQPCNIMGHHTCGAHT